MTKLDDVHSDAAQSDAAVTAFQTPLFELQHDFFDDLPELCVQWQASPVPAPELAALNHELVDRLGLDRDGLRSSEGVSVLAGNRVPEGAVPVALGYAGHQFGNYSPRLGDGRALLLGELTGPDGQLLDLHLKGSGRTPFARGGDGKATIGPMLREYLIAEALNSMGVPTTRSLAVVTTGEEIHRTRLEPGAVLTRVAASHIRVGTFEYAVRLGGVDLVRRLADHAIGRHYPQAADADNPYRGLLIAVVDAQAELVAKWMLLGFIHGVMNTDNMTISGEGIDYGPCAFMDRYDPSTVFSSIDHAGRYAYGNQAPIAIWNLARLAETLLGLIAEDSDEAVEVATGVVNSFQARFNSHWQKVMAGKLGFWSRPLGDDALHARAPSAVTAFDGALSDETLFDDLPTIMHTDGRDWTLTFRQLAAQLRESPGGKTSATGAADSEDFKAWVERWRDQLEREGIDPQRAAEVMDSVNPLYIPRNHVVEEALEAATAGDLGPFRELIEVLGDPFTGRAGLERFAAPAPQEFNTRFRTFCGT